MAKPKDKMKPGRKGRAGGAGRGRGGAGLVASDKTGRAELRVVQVVEADPAKPDLNKRALIDAVVARSDIKRREVKPVVEAMLAVLGETLAEGRGLNLEPLGKLRINRTEERGNRRIVVAKLRQSLDGARAEVGPDDEDSDGAPD